MDVTIRIERGNSRHRIYYKAPPALPKKISLQDFPSQELPQSEPKTPISEEKHLRALSPSLYEPEEIQKINFKQAGIRSNHQLPVASTTMEPRSAKNSQSDIHLRQQYRLRQSKKPLSAQHDGLKLNFAALEKVPSSNLYQKSLQRDFERPKNQFYKRFLSDDVKAIESELFPAQHLHAEILTGNHVQKQFLVANQSIWRSQQFQQPLASEKYSVSDFPTTNMSSLQRPDSFKSLSRAKNSKILTEVNGNEFKKLLIGSEQIVLSPRPVTLMCQSQSNRALYRKPPNKLSHTQLTAIKDGKMAIDDGEVLYGAKQDESKYGMEVIEPPRAHPASYTVVPHSHPNHQHQAVMPPSDEYSRKIVQFRKYKFNEESSLPSDQDQSMQDNLRAKRENLDISSGEVYMKSPPFSQPSDGASQPVQSNFVSQKSLAVQTRDQAAQVTYTTSDPPSIFQLQPMNIILPHARPPKQGFHPWREDPLHVYQQGLQTQNKTKKRLRSMQMHRRPSKKVLSVLQCQKIKIEPRQFPQNAPAALTRYQGAILSINKGCYGSGFGFGAVSNRSKRACCLQDA